MLLLDILKNESCFSVLTIDCLIHEGVISQTKCMKKKQNIKGYAYVVSITK